jgi:Uncharacterized protein conserved in bacteria
VSAVEIDIHADDYALSAGASENILKCIRAGKLDSVSVLTNMSCYGEYASRYLKERKEWKKEPLLSVHLNFMEGKALAGALAAPDLVDGKGYFSLSWGKLLLWSFCPWKYGRVKAQLKKEIKAQTENFIRCFGREKPLRFDGHQHTQMIPVVYCALLEVIREERYPLSYIRVTKEPILPFCKEVSLWKTYRPVNWVKNLLLNFLAPAMEWKVRKASGQKPMFLWGVLFSGNMDCKRVQALLPAIKEQSRKRGRVLEILFHPGFTAKDGMAGEEFCSEDAKAFYCSEGRKREYRTVMEGNFMK